MKDQITVAVAGNPNCGKTTLFNGLTGGKQTVGNWPGVTVEKKEGHFEWNGVKVRLVDLPGIYSLSSHSEDEQIAVDYIRSGEPDIILNIVDAINLERNLYLTTQLAEMNVPMFVVLNRSDLAKKEKLSIDAEKLSAKLGMPVVPCTATQKDSMPPVADAICEVASDGQSKQAAAKITYHNEIEDVLTKWEMPLRDKATAMGVSPRWLAVKLLEGNEWIKKQTAADDIIAESEIDKESAKIESTLHDSPDIIIADTRYGFINGLVKDTVTKKESKHTLTEKIDKVVLNRVLGIPIFLFIMYLLFWVVTTIGSAFIDFFDIAFGALFVDGFGELLTAIGVPQWLKVILADSIGAGIQTVATFIPPIFFMFLMLSILEDSGYMARAAFVMDRFMRMIGLPGKSFVPMLVGFGCSVPAIMGSRTLESKRDRLLTIFMTPFMSCGARLPVYALFAVVFFPNSSGLMVFSIYIIGIVLAILTGLLLKKTVFKGEASHFIMELPVYNPPRVKHILLHTWERLKLFLFRAGKVVVTAVAVLAFLNSLGTDGTFGNEDKETSVLSHAGKAVTPIFAPFGVEEDNWPASVALFTGLFAKEAVVGTLNALYSQTGSGSENSSDETQPEPSASTESTEPVEPEGAVADAGEAEDEEEEEFSLGASMIEALQTIPENLSGIFGRLADPLDMGSIENTEDKEAMGEQLEVEQETFSAMSEHFTKGKWQAFAYLLFVLIYVPCMAALGAIARETGIKFMLAQALYLTALGWIVATLFYQIVVGHSAAVIIVALSVLIALVVGLAIYGRKKTAEDWED